MLSCRIAPTLASLGNRHGKSIAEVLGHPLRDTLRFLPQGLLIGGIFHKWSKSPGKLTGGLLQELYSDVEKSADGTVTPWAYGGTYMSIFCLHQEDAMMPSANLHLAGATKAWIGLSNYDLEELHNALAGERALNH
jgi:hypothetical protein